MSKGARSTVFEGPKGMCPCCDKTSEISIASARGAPRCGSWVVPTEVMVSIYSAIIPLIREKKTKDGRTRYYLFDPQKFMTGRAVRANKLYFVEGGDHSLAGPFGTEGLKVFFGKQQQDDQTLYVVSTTHRSLKCIRNAHVEREEGAPEEEPAGEEDLF